MLFSHSLLATQKDLDGWRLTKKIHTRHIQRQNTFVPVYRLMGLIQ